ncbi:MAG: DUF1549 and DUF1553 domain-containing protein [Pirellula sp.]|nr:DUF1549 and DUF1553 domain-containing protein [Pirellula sp.]
MKSYTFVCWICASLISISCLAQQPAEPSSAPSNSPSDPPPVAVAATPAEWTSLVVYPPKIKLSAKTDSQHVVAVATRKDGVTMDVTDQVAWALDADTFVDWKDFVVSPKADGASRLTATWNGMTSTTEITTSNSQVINPIHFEKDVMPILTKAGCNTGSCHGAARGKDGFRLSLFGYDPVGDYQRITREIGIRRINLAVPEQSLLLLKAIGAVQHSGGKKIEPGSKHYNTILAWLKNGATPDAARAPVVTSVDVYPSQAVLEGADKKQRLVAVAKYADGTERDVWDLATFTTNNERTGAVAVDGLVTSGVRGEAYVFARFDTHTVGSQILALPEGINYKTPEAAGNYIDTLVKAKLQKLRLPESGICTDEEFVRRTTIDIVGLLPTDEETKQFVTSTEPDKRAKWIDSLLERKEFSEIWAMKWSNLLMIKSNNQVSYKAAYLYYNWLTNKIASNTPIDQVVRELISATGGTFESPATNFYQVELDRLKLSENVAQVFMGIRTQCAQCHNHPFDRWTMDDYYGFTAFFAQIGRKQGEDYRQLVVFNAGGGETNHPVGGAVVKPKFLGGVVPEVAGKDRREVLANWITSQDNPFFAKSVANRVWAHYTGVGIVNPVDDFRASNPPSNPELLDELAKRLVEYKYDIKQLVRDICNSQTYQRSVTPVPGNEDDTRNYSHASVRRIPAENLLDCISQATNTKDKFQGLPIGARAVQIADGSTSNYFLTSFGRSQRTTVCEEEATTDPSLSQALHLINGDATGGKIANGGLLKTWKDQGLTQQQIIEKIYMRCISRAPTEAESSTLLKMIAEAPNEEQGLQDVFWAVLNSREFIFNH